MTQIPLYPSTLQSAVQRVDPLERDPSCQACSLHRHAHTVCMPARAKRGGHGTLLVVSEYPSASADRAGRGYESDAERWLRRLIERHWSGSVVYDYAIRCYPAGRTVTRSHHDHCRGYLADVLQAVSADRVIVLGNHAAKGVLGYSRGSAAHCNRRGYAYLGDTVPVFILSKPHDPAVNGFLRKAFEADLQWALQSSPELPPMSTTTVAVSPSDGDTITQYATGAQWIAVDVETYGRMFEPGFRLLSVGICRPNAAQCVALDADALAPGTASREALIAVLTDEKIGKVGHNIKYDFQALAQGLGVEMSPVVGDTRLAYKLLSPDGDAQLDSLADIVGMGGHKDEADDIVKQEVRRLRAQWRADHPGQSTRHFHAYAYAYDALPREVNLRYVSRDAMATARLYELLEPKLRQAYGGDLWQTYCDVIMPATVALCHIESYGVPISAERVQELGEHLAERIEQLESDLSEHGDIRPASHASVSGLLYDTLGLPVESTTQSGKPSTDKATLERMRSKHPAIPMILEWRKLSKLLSTYVTGLLPHIREDGRIHPTLQLDGTGTGRLSCRDPNLQNQPARGGKEAKLLKDCYRAGDGRVLVQVDYGTLEIRVAALLSQDIAMTDVLRSGVDFHLGTAELIAPVVWNMTAEQVRAEFQAGNKTRRSIAKTINFGTLYGQSAQALAAQISAILGSPFAVEAAEEAQRAILGQFSQLRQWIQEQQRHVLTHGDVWTYWDGQRARRRPLTAAGYADSARSGTAIRSSYNTPIQGTGSDYCLRSVVAMERHAREFWGRRCMPILTVHDSIVFDVEHDVDLVCELVAVSHEVMTGWPSGRVPLVVDYEIGGAWGSLQPLPVDNDGNVTDVTVIEGVRT